MKTVALIQARMGSIRLPGKMMMPLHEIPIIDWVIERVKRSELLDEIVLCAPTNTEDDALETRSKALGINTFRGSENDVLLRFYEAALRSSADRVVRICADNPLVSPEQIDELIRFFDQHNCDYAYNHIPKGNSYPDGLGAEIMSVNTLEELNARATLPAHREHCFSYLTDHPEKYSISTFDPLDPNLQKPEVKLDVDTLEDLNKLNDLEIYPGITDQELMTRF